MVPHSVPLYLLGISKRCKNWTDVETVFCIWSCENGPFVQLKLFGLKIHCNKSQFKHRPLNYKNKYHIITENQNALIRSIGFNLNMLLLFVLFCNLINYFFKWIINYYFITNNILYFRRTLIVSLFDLIPKIKKKNKIKTWSVTEINLTWL